VYNDCGYVESQRSTVQLSARREIGVLTNVVDERDDREARERAEFERESEVLVGLQQSQRDKKARKAALNGAIEARARQLGERDALRRLLMQWQESRSAPETEKLRAAREAVDSLEKKLEGAEGAKIAAQQRVSEREHQVSATFAKLTEQFGASGRYAPSDEKRPFQMLGADGAAYTVLEILLGDLACAQDGSSTGGAHPGVLIFDCPREREMSPHVYERFLMLVDEVCKKSRGLQVVLTTTTPPPRRLREPPTCILRLSRASDDDLLLKRRIKNLLARTTPTLHGGTDEEEKACSPRSRRSSSRAWRRLPQTMALTRSLSARATGWCSQARTARSGYGWGCPAKPSSLRSRNRTSLVHSTGAAHPCP
jgi:hypothetical protein